MAMAVTGIMAGFIGNMIYYEINTYELVTNRNQGLHDSRHAVNLMSSDIRAIVSADSIYQASSDSLRFDDISNTMISYKYQGGHLYRNSALLLTKVSYFKFTYFNGSGNAITSPVSDPTTIRSIAITISKAIRGQTVKTVNKITPRNF